MPWGTEFVWRKGGLGFSLWYSYPGTDGCIPRPRTRPLPYSSVHFLRRKLKLN
jgi:hypothetical protein